MKNVTLTGAILLACVSGSAAATPIDFYQADGVAVMAAGSLNPPDPVEGCNRAKQDARNKAAAAGFAGAATWKRLSNDSDCKLDTQGGTTTGYFYIFSASGTFYQ
jgi:hypothetical protein